MSDSFHNIPQLGTTVHFREQLQLPILFPIVSHTGIIAEITVLTDTYKRLIIVRNDYDGYDADYL